MQFPFYLFVEYLVGVHVVARRVTETQQQSAGGVRHAPPAATRHHPHGAAVPRRASSHTPAGTTEK